METLAPMVFDLYTNALAISSKKTYTTGTNHFKKFLAAFPSIGSVSLPLPPPSPHILTLCFFAVNLFQKKSIKSESTIRSYIKHVKNKWIQNGCDPEILESDILDRVLKGMKRSLPPKRDARPAFLLPHYKLPKKYQLPTSGRQCATIAAIIFGFFGLARFHVLEKLRVDALSMVDRGGHEYKCVTCQKETQKKFFSRQKLSVFSSISKTNSTL